MSGIGGGSLGPLLLVAAWVTWVGPASRRSALGRLAAAHPRPGGITAAPRSSRATSGPSAVVRLGGAAGAACVVLTLFGSAGAFVAAPVVLGAGAGVWWALGRLEPSGLRRLRRQVVGDVPFAVDLFASCVAAGASTPRALRLAGDGVGGPVGTALSGAASALVLGASAAEAVRPWHDEPVLAPLGPFARVLVRSMGSGVAVVPAATRLARDLREARHWEVDAAARRLGVRATAPLGVCFLPAFVLLGIVPLVVAGGRAVGV